MEKKQQLFVIRSSQGTIFVNLNTGWAVQITPSDDATDFASIENIHKFNLTEREEYRKEDILENDNLDILDFGYWFGGDPENPLTWTYVKPDSIWRNLMVELKKPTKVKINKNTFYEAYANALGGYSKLIELLMTGTHSTIETDIELDDVPDHEFTLRCYDGIAVGLSKDKTLNVVVEYPKKATLTEANCDEIIEYRGLYEQVADRFQAITFGDIMVRYGKTTFIHHITK